MNPINYWAEIDMRADPNWYGKGHVQIQLLRHQPLLHFWRGRINVFPGVVQVVSSTRPNAEHAVTCTNEHHFFAEPVHRRMQSLGG
jgi:hypothetical protein